jgi:dipeptidyl aminopeptidase/acylaminoacyl peptidase
MSKTNVPYGSWKSPIASELIVARSISLADVRLDGGNIYWLEGRPQEQGRNVVVRAGSGGEPPRDLVPAPFNARTRVHEYGGGAWLVDDGTLYFSHFADGQLYRQAEGGAPQPLTAAPARPNDWRFADGVIDRGRARWIGVREDHTGQAHDPEKWKPVFGEDHAQEKKREAVNTIVAVDLAGAAGPGRVLAGGHDFFSSPRLSPDGNALLWLAWDHPNLPWNGTTLYLAALDPDGMPAEPEAIAGGVAESIFQPEWSPDGSEIVFVSDRSGWWNLFRYQVARRETRALVPMAAEFGQPQWNFGMSTYAFAGPERIVSTYSTNGLGRLAVVDLATETLRPLETPFTEIGAVRAEGDRVAFLGGAPRLPGCVVTLDLNSGAYGIEKKSTDILDRADLRIADYLTTVRPVEFPTRNGKTAFALFYPPFNPDAAAPADERPPVVVKVHGGPTAAASSTLSLRNQFWTSRGIAVLDVNYGGSTGFGREYRERLYGNWGVVDVEDCINGVKFLAQQGLVDAKRAVITGGSAGGYTALAALAFHDFFQGGASHYGVSDIAALARDTHKFESRYLDWLIGPYPKEEALYRERSPLFHAERVSKPVIFFQGDEDAVVPPNQTEAMVDALRRRGNPVGYFLFAGEQHGFRKAGNIQRSLDAELYFYAIDVFRTGLTF